MTSLIASRPPLQNSPWRKQIAALCHRKVGSARQVLLITSRDTGRWVIPKGWPMKGKADHDAALQEAWEEAGVKKARVQTSPIGHYAYDKKLKNGAQVAVRADVYMTDVKQLSAEFPEDQERTSLWCTLAQAAKRVDEPQLKSLLRRPDLFLNFQAPA